MTMPSGTRTDGNQQVRLLSPNNSQVGPSTSAAKASTTARRPWADEPWPLMETPSKTQQITHPVLHIANEIAHTHNAMIRGLNAIFLQAPFVRQATDVADLMFLTQAWSAWLLDYHALKETAMLPGFEAVLGLKPGTLGETRINEGVNEHGDTNRDGNEAANEEKEKEKAEGEDQAPQPLASLLCHVHAYATAAHAEPASYSSPALRSLLARLALRLVPHLTRQVLFLLQQLLRPLLPPFSHHNHHHDHHHHNDADADADADAIANALLRAYLACAGRASDALDRPVAAPLILGLRDAAFEAGRGRDWPALSVPAVHAVADRLAPRHAGAWRFLPCDMWGRARGLRLSEG